MRTNAISAVLVLFLAANSGLAQVEEARQAIERGENVRAVNILSAELAERPTADTYLYLGIAYRNMKEYLKAEEILNEGSRRFPGDSRFHNQLADLFLENNDSDGARAQLKRTLAMMWNLPGRSCAVPCSGIRATAKHRICWPRSICLKVKCSRRSAPGIRVAGR